MRGSSETNESAFEGLTLRNALSLIEVLKDSEIRSKDRVRKLYSNHSHGFDATLNFLIEIHVVRETNRSLQFRIEPPETDGGKWLLSCVVGSSSSHRSEMYRYLRNYMFDGDKLVYRPLAQNRSKESAVRNFLMDLDVIHSEYDGLYSVAASHEKLIVEGLRSKTSPEEFTKTLDARKEIGATAELEALKYERARLSSAPWLLESISHTALEDVGAGYDILSSELTEKGSHRLPRYIEVKALSVEKPRFFLSRNELGVAKRLGLQYYLYLVPYEKDRSFNSEALEIIRDPARELFDSSEWVSEIDAFRFSKVTDEGM